MKSWEFDKLITKLCPHACITVNKHFCDKCVALRLTSKRIFNWEETCRLSQHSMFQDIETMLYEMKETLEDEIRTFYIEKGKLIERESRDLG